MNACPVSGSKNIASLLSQELFTAEYNEFDSRPPCFYRLSTVNPTQSLIHLDGIIVYVSVREDHSALKSTQLGFQMWSCPSLSIKVLQLDHNVCFKDHISVQ